MTVSATASPSSPHMTPADIRAQWEALSPCISSDPYLKKIAGITFYPSIDGC